MFRPLWKLYATVYTEIVDLFAVNPALSRVAATLQHDDGQEFADTPTAETALSPPPATVPPSPIVVTAARLHSNAETNSGQSRSSPRGTSAASVVRMEPAVAAASVPRSRNEVRSLAHGFPSTPYSASSSFSDPPSFTEGDHAASSSAASPSSLAAVVPWEPSDAPCTALENWSVFDVQQWLRSLGPDFLDYTAFYRAGIKGSYLVKLATLPRGEADTKLERCFHIRSELHRELMLDNLAEIKKQHAVPSTTTDAGLAPFTAASVVEVAPRATAARRPVATTTTAAPVTSAAAAASSTHARTDLLAEMAAHEQTPGVVDASLLFGSIHDEEKSQPPLELAHMGNMGCSSGARSPIFASASATPTPTLNDPSRSSRSHRYVASSESGSADSAHVANQPSRQQLCPNDDDGDDDDRHESLHDFVHRKGALFEQQRCDFLQQFVAHIRTLANLRRWNLSPANLLLDQHHMLVGFRNFGSHASPYAAPECLSLAEMAAADVRAGDRGHSAFLFFMLGGMQAVAVRHQFFDQSSAFIDQQSGVLDSSCALVRFRVSNQCQLRSLLQPDSNKRSNWELFNEHAFWRNDVANQDATVELRAENKELRTMLADRQAQVSALEARQEVSSSAAARLSDAGAGAAPNVQHKQAQKLDRDLLPLIGDREGCEAGQEGSGEPAPVRAEQPSPAANRVWQPPPSGEGALAPDKRRILRRKLTASMLLGCARAQAQVLCDEPDDAESVERAAVAESTRLLVGMSDHIQSFSPLVRSAYVVAFNLQSARAAFKRCHQNINAEARTAFFRFIYASLCQLHTSSGAADAPPHSLLNFLGTPSVSAAREQCILALNAPAMETQGAEMPSNFCELLKELLQCLTQLDPPPANEPLFAVQRIPWTNERLIAWLRQLGDAPNDKESFQLA